MSLDPLPVVEARKCLHFVFETIQHASNEILKKNKLIDLNFSIQNNDTWVTRMHKYMKNIFNNTNYTSCEYSPRVEAHAHFY